MLKTSKAISSNQLKPTKNESFMRMKKLAMLSIGMLAFALQPANAQTSLFTTYDDFSAFSAGWGAAPSAVNTFSTDTSTINGIGNLTAPGGPGTSGSLLSPQALVVLGPSGGGLDRRSHWSQPRLAISRFYEAIDPGTDGINAVNDSGNIYMDYSLPDNEGGTYFRCGGSFPIRWKWLFRHILFDFARPIWDSRIHATAGKFIRRPFLIQSQEVQAFNGFGFGIMGNTDYDSALPFTVDNITVAAVPEPGTLALMGLGLTGLAIIRRRRQS